MVFLTTCKFPHRLTKVPRRDIKMLIVTVVIQQSSVQTLVCFKLVISRLSKQNTAF